MQCIALLWLDFVFIFTSLRPLARFVLGGVRVQCFLGQCSRVWTVILHEARSFRPCVVLVARSRRFGHFFPRHHELEAVQGFRVHSRAGTATAHSSHSPGATETVSPPRIVTFTSLRPLALLFWVECASNVSSASAHGYGPLSILHETSLFRPCVVLVTRSRWFGLFFLGIMS